jgi:hypothetical protein
MSRWTPQREPAVARARRTAALSAARLVKARFARPRRAGSEPPPVLDGEWTTARIVAANIAVLSGLAAVIVLVASVLEQLARPLYFTVFVLLTMLLMQWGGRLRRRGLERLGRSVTAWAGLTGALVAVSAVLTLELTRFVPELIAVAAAWLLVLGVWKNLAVLVTASVLLTLPMVWGAFVWNRSLIPAVLILVAAGGYARTGAVHRVLFGAVVVCGLVLGVATGHQLTHALGDTAVDGSDLLVLLIALAVLAAAADLESWRADWAAYGAVLRFVTAAVVLVLAAAAASPGQVETWVAQAPAASLPRVTVAGTAALIATWAVMLQRPSVPGGRLRLAAWTVAVVATIGAVNHAYGTGVVRWVAVVALAAWGLRTVRAGLRRSHPWAVLVGFLVVFAAVLPPTAARPGLTPLVLLLTGVAAAGAAVVMLARGRDGAVEVPALPGPAASTLVPAVEEA